MIYNLASNIVAFSTQRYTEEAELPYSGFNVTSYTGDDPSHVRSCQQRLADYLRIPPESLIIPRQTHGTRCVVVTSKLLASKRRESALEGVDAVITDLPDVCVGVSTADCLPILFYDTVTGAIGAAHAGWRGTVARIGVQTIAKMYEAFGTQSSNLRCVLGPCIGPTAFEVGADVYEAFRLARFPMAQIATRVPTPARVRPVRRWYIDLPEANAWQLERAGVPPQNITFSGICCHTDYAHYFSARRLGINSGRTYSGIVRHL